ncbi:ras-related protein Rab-21 [Anthonomus grandis grandis]|uniref:ras-related protein Rab-21 n=1 Tax=Anthonomus grandis grandis TaxID=2921223 RepID=UPI00216665F4|nr:ras-related protein Rab-21 [Anthonomus grandis grandis]
MDGNSRGLESFKVVLLGEGCVGKTSLVLQFVEDKFNSKHISTVQAAFLNKNINIDGKRMKLAIWDTAGQEQFHALGPIYYRSSNGAVLVYDITNLDSFQKGVKTWVKELRKMLGKDVCLAIVGNKTDLEKERAVSVEEAQEYATKVGAKHYFTSAKLNDGVEDMFLSLAQDMMAKREEKQANGSLSRQNSVRRNMLVVADDEMEPQPSKSCCGA